MPDMSDIDWPEIHRRLSAADDIVHKVWKPEGEEVERILVERAHALAQEATSEDAGEYLEAIEFHLAYESYAIEVHYVREVYPLARLTPLPCTPDFVLGIVNVRGQIVSVVDVRTFFELPATGLTDLNKLIVLESGGMSFGILADAIVGIRRFPVAGLQPSLPTLSGIREKYLKGISQERTILLDAQKLLSDERIVVQEQPG